MDSTDSAELVSSNWRSFALSKEMLLLDSLPRRMGEYAIRKGVWQEMARLIDDEMLEVFAVVCEPNDLPKKLAERYAGLVDRLALYVPFIPGERDEEWSELLAGVRAQLSSNCYN